MFQDRWGNSPWELSPSLQHSWRETDAVLVAPSVFAAVMVLGLMAWVAVASDGKRAKVDPEVNRSAGHDCRANSPWELSSLQHSWRETDAVLVAPCVFAAVMVLGLIAWVAVASDGKRAKVAPEVNRSAGHDCRTHDASC